VTPRRRSQLLITLGIAASIVLLALMSWEADVIFPDASAVWGRTFKGYPHLQVVSLATSVPWILFLAAFFWFSFLKWRRTKVDRRQRARRR
jgi:hypothetical protein